MSARIPAVVVIACLTAFTAPAPAGTLNVPLPALIADANLVAVVEVVCVDPAIDRTLQPPGFAREVTRPFRTFHLRCKEVLWDPSGTFDANTPPEKLPSVKALAQAPPPRRPGVFIADGPSYPNLQPGREYVVILKGFGERYYYLPAYFKNFTEVRDRSADFIAQVRDAAKVDEWAWGEAVDGLRLAVVPARKEQNLPPQPRRNPAKDPRPAHVPLVVALRNVGDKPVTINTYLADRTLRLHYTTPDGTSHEQPIYRGMDRRRGPFDPDKHVATVRPGQIVSLGPAGIMPYGLGIAMKTVPGKVTIRASYASDRKAPLPHDRTLWRGAVRSDPAEVMLVDSPVPIR